jgi:hypothetical protein
LTKGEKYGTIIKKQSLLEITTDFRWILNLQLNLMQILKLF